MQHSMTFQVGASNRARGCAFQSRREPFTAVQEDNKRLFCCLQGVRVPVWSLLVVLSTAFLVVVGVVVFVLTRVGAVAAMDIVGESYRSLACTLVESQVAGFLGPIETATKQLASYAAHSALGPDVPTNEDMRLKMFTMLSTASTSASFFAIGFSDGGSFGLVLSNTDGFSATPRPMFWAWSGNRTRYSCATWPATNVSDPSVGLTSESEWMQRFGEVTYLCSRYNATQKGWYQAGARSTAGVAYGPVRPTGTLWNGQSVLTLPVVSPLRSGGTLRLVAASEFYLTYLDSFLRTVSSTMFPGTVTFLVEVDTGLLLATSEPGQLLVGAGGQRVLAVNASSALIRRLSVGIADPLTGWARFGVVATGYDTTFVVAGYYANVRRLNVQGLSWALVVGTDSGLWHQKVNAGLPVTVAFAVAFIIGSSLMVVVLMRLLTRPLSRLVVEVEKLREMDVDLVRPFPRSMLSEVDALMQAFNSLTKDLAEYRKFMPSSLFTKELAGEENAALSPPLLPPLEHPPSSPRVLHR
eukprot:RCo045642